MSITRKHYRGLAGALARARADDRVIRAVGDYLAKDNPQFNREAFEEAAHGKPPLESASGVGVDARGRRHRDDDRERAEQIAANPDALRDRDRPGK